MAPERAGVNGLRLLTPEEIDTVGMDILLVGGSGFVSGTLARRALEKGHAVTVVTRGQKPVPDGVASVQVDRKDTAAFSAAISDQNAEWDLVVDCIGYNPEDAAQDVAAFRDRTGHLVFISTDFVFDPGTRIFPQPEATDHYIPGENYGSKKRLCELELINADTGDMSWTVVRPCHIYGPGSLLGCLPDHGRDPGLIDLIRKGGPLELVGGGHFLQQPIFARDLADLILSCHGVDAANGGIFCAAGPDIIESSEYYNIIARVLGAPEPRIVELPVGQYLQDNPQSVSFLCHRIYDLTRMKTAGLAAPATPIEEGLKAHVESMI